MTEGRPWTYQADLYGICGVVHCLLYGSFLVTVRDPKTQELRPKQPFKRYHQADLWRPLFRDFLNVKVRFVVFEPANERFVSCCFSLLFFSIPGLFEHPCSGTAPAAT